MEIKISAIKCNHCGDIIYSRCNHDLRRCSCDKIFIDRGLNIIGDTEENNPYSTRVKGIPHIDYTTTQVVLREFNTRKECRRWLNLDYIKNTNKYGRIKREV